nr:uncharacterized protein LOC124814665 [Hydra vulgaris]
MKDKKVRSRMQCLKAGCDCDEYTKEKGFDLCAYCDHAPVLHKESATLSQSEIDFSLDNNKVTSPFKNQCIQQAKPFQDTAGKIVFASKIVLHHKNNTLFGV